MDLMIGRPLKGRRLVQTKEFLGRLGLAWEPGIETTVILVEEDQIFATGSRQGKVLKCLGVSCQKQGEGLSARVLTELVKDAYSQGFSHLFLYTKPDNFQMFEDLGFYPVAESPQVILLENRRNGVADFVKSLHPTVSPGVVGGIVANCNPFTNGHLYLIEEAAKACDQVHLFILSEDQSEFSADVRLDLVRQGTAHLPNVAVHPTGDYLVSSATFPAYFLKEKAVVSKAQSQLDVEIFARYFAPAFGITKRFVGTEPHSVVTNAYNQQMIAQLPGLGIEVIEIPRVEAAGEPISASRVRALLREDRLEDTRPLVPPTTFAYLKKHYGEAAQGGGNELK